MRIKYLLAMIICAITFCSFCACSEVSETDKNGESTAAENGESTAAEDDDTFSDLAIWLMIFAGASTGGAVVATGKKKGEKEEGEPSDSKTDTEEEHEDTAEEHKDNNNDGE